MIPIAYLSTLIPTSLGRHKCRENWPAIEYEQAYNLFLCAVMFIVPLFILILTYSLITRTLYKGMEKETRGTCPIVNYDYTDESSDIMENGNHQLSYWFPGSDRTFY